MEGTNFTREELMLNSLTSFSSNTLFLTRSSDFRRTMEVKFSQVLDFLRVFSNDIHKMNKIMRS